MYSRKMLIRLGGRRRTSGATEKLSPTGFPGVGYGSWPTISTRTSAKGCWNARSARSARGRWHRRLPQEQRRIAKEIVDSEQRFVATQVTVLAKSAQHPVARGQVTAARGHFGPQEVTHRADPVRHRGQGLSPARLDDLA